jgi:hypothetical protein
MEALRDFFDAYSRTARLYPALLAALPIVWTAAAFGARVEGGILSAIAASTVVLLAIATLSASYARDRGKVAEEDLIIRWGGLPTTILLRHSDDRIEKPTKDRWRHQLAAMCPDLSFPDATGELADSIGADAVYRSATRRLIEQRRDPTHRLIQKENTQYGFRRNLYGLKPTALVVLAGCAAGTAMLLRHIELTVPFDAVHQLDVLARANRAAAYAISLDAVTVAMWLLVVTPDYVRRAGDEYAIALLRSLDVKT